MMRYDGGEVRESSVAFRLVCAEVVRRLSTFGTTADSSAFLRGLDWSFARTFGDSVAVVLDVIETKLESG